MGNRNLLESPPLQEQVPNGTRIRIETLLDLDIPEPELFPSAAAGNSGSDKILGTFLPRGFKGSGRVCQSNKIYDGRSWLLRWRASNF